jgi:ABC-type transporter Mla subunit MlaD
MTAPAMTNERNALRAGLFIVISTVLVVGVVLAIKGVGRFTEGRVTRTVTFKLTDDIGGLRVGDDVRVGGWKVGNVQTIEAVGLEGEDARIHVTFTLPARFKLRENARVAVQQTLTGSTALNIDHLGKGREYAEAEPVVGRPDPKTALLASLGDAGPDLAATIKDARQVAADVRAVTVPKTNAALDSFKATGDLATALVADVKGQVAPVVTRYNGVADKTGAMMQSITDMVGPSALDWRGLIANLNQTSAALKDRTPGLLGQVEKTLKGAQTAMEDVQATVANTKDLSGSLKGVVGGNESKLQGIIDNLKLTGENLKATSAEVRRSPWRLLYKPAANEVTNLTLYDSARQFADGANNLNDAAATLRDAIKTGKASDREIKGMVDRLEQSFDKFREVEGKLWAEVKQ